MFEYDAHTGEAPTDDLFLERLDTFMEKSLGDIKAFAEREQRPYEETRRCIAQWHTKYLFQPSTGPSVSSRSNQMQSTLRDASRILETLADVSGIQSFLLAIDPNDSSDGGFLGGSLIGREFWRGMRGGGDTGARAFKAFYATQSQTLAKVIHKRAVERHVPTPPPPKVRLGETPARFLKNELYESVRNALRLASGVQTAEMKWTNPEKLDVFGVRLVGWPEGVPAQNPSTLKAGQNKLLHEAIQNGSMRFEKLPGRQPSGSGECGTKEDIGDTADDFSWAYDVNARPTSPPPTAPLRARSPIQTSVMATNPTPLDISDTAQTTWALDPPAEVETSLASYSVDDPWEHEFSEGMMDTLDTTEWMCEPHNLQLERPRKRPRSEEPGSRADHVLK